MTVGSLFSGIGGFDLGFERAGFEIRWQVEIDPFCRAVLAKHWPDVRRYDDVRTVGAELGYVDVICGGFPCQDLSSAGKRTGIDGTRSGLWREFIRVVGEQRPRGVVLENVHHAWRQWVPVLRRALWELGYASLPIRLRASDFGAWHQRSRVFVVAHVDPSALRLESWRRGWPFWTEPPLFAHAREARQAVSERRGQEVGVSTQARADADVDQAGCTDGEGRRANAGQSRERSALADADTLRELQPEGSVSDERRWAGYGAQWAIEPDVVRVVHGVSSRLVGRRMAARIGALGNAVIPEEPEWIARQILAAEGLSV